MNLYIETENGQTKNHPAFEDNLLQAFGVIPDHWEPFTRVQRPLPTAYQILESEEPTYAKVDGVWTDVWALRDMTAEEKAAKQQAVRDAFNAREQASNWSTWTLDEATCLMVPPVPRPDSTEGVLVFWCGADNAWKEAPARPDGNYKFDFLAWQWVQVVDSTPT
jgi:hypothetical protein